MAPPAKRLKRTDLDDSDDENVKPRAGNTLANFLVSSPSSPTKHRVPQPSPSPSKGRGTTRASTRGSTQPKNGRSPSSKKTAKDIGKGDERAKTADLKTLFSKQAQREPKKPTAIDDLLSDPISEDEISELKSSSSSLVGQHARKRLRKEVQTAPSSSVSSSQRFLKPTKPNNAEHNAGEDQRPWSERFGPRNLDELVVHKRKVGDVRKWLQDVMAGRMRQRILILKGPAGSAKTTTLRLIADSMGYEILEWKNPTNNASSGFVSASARFDEFLGKGGKFGALDMDDEPASQTQARSYGGTNSENVNRILLLEEFPNTFSRTSTVLSAFRKSILQYLAEHVPALSVFTQQSQREPIKPLVMVISETLLTTTSASADSFTAHRLLGPEILRHPGVGIIEFNPVAPTLLAKALGLIVQKESRKSGRKSTPGPQVLQKLGEIGDIRNAISSLEFLCLKGDDEADWGARVTFTKPKRGANGGASLTKGEADSLELISQREASLGIFHAVGKVVYNKRDEAAAGNDVEKLPPYLSHMSRPKRSQVDVDSLMDETGTDTHTFISALHENYAPSCISTDAMDLSTPIDYVNECIEALSQSDLLSPSRDVFFGGRGGFAGQDASSHILRQDEITFQVAVRGLLFALPNPVHRKQADGSRGSDAFKMFYPQSLKLWRAREEVEGLVDMWSSKLLKGDLTGPTKNVTEGASAFRKPKSSSAGETSWMQRQQQSSRSSAVDSSLAESQDKVNDDAIPLLSLGSAARREMLLERLPYMAHVARSSSHAGKSPIKARDLDKVVAFQGMNAPTDEASDAEDGEENDASAAWATDKPSEEASPRKKRAGIKPGAMSGLLAQKLVLSDDDIED
ncbi:Rad17 cell cycle checkpoint protein-domain-containing protein [Emericellopsis atlantica]|uniref:Rad17 cell cycle checkpoint protein-domain-containing protein n=1 Tax=Emericellopsis atlantica TaxID=2614577 RepID=A0A9P7ZDB5_9HYPO|nr:Rad17 cell cycle checkpoint protein-domain-containing protein [Emericellopsis atlantica]KAG9249651.1 Rad17 cell cycle checkpoint protein-domain-containing protein [Emericellopsis atlantica]